MTEPMEAKRCGTCGGENGHRLGCDFGLSDPPPAPVDERCPNVECSEHNPGRPPQRSNRQAKRRCRESASGFVGYRCEEPWHDTPSEPMEAKRCPTCGSDDPRVCESSGDAPHSHGRWLSGHGQGACCPDPFHDPPPAPVDEGERCPECNSDIVGGDFPCRNPWHIPVELQSSLDQALRERDLARTQLELPVHNRLAILTTRAEAAEAQRDRYRERIVALERGLASVRAFMLDPDLPDSDSLERVREELAELDPDSHAALSNPTPPAA